MCCKKYTIRLYRLICAEGIILIGYMFASIPVYTYRWNGSVFSVIIAAMAVVAELYARTSVLLYRYYIIIATNQIQSSITIARFKPVIHKWCTRTAVYNGACIQRIPLH